MLHIKALDIVATYGRAFRWMLSISWFVVVETAVTACGPGQVHSAGGGSLEYVGISGHDVMFELKNGSPKKISFRGTYSILKGADALDTQIVCRTATATTGYEHPIGPQDGLKSINVSPGDQMRLRIENEIDPGDKGALCHLRLKLEDRTVIESSEFIPR